MQRKQSYKSQTSGVPLTRIFQNEERKYDLSKLTEFDPALVYSFRPESCTFPNPPMTYEVLHLAGQHQDVFEAYLYGQEVLRTIREIGIAAITPSMVLEWLNRAHSFIA